MARPLMPIAGRVVAITGGARGIGGAIAAAVARKGGRVAIGDLDAGLAHETAATIGRGAIGCALDVRSSASFAAFLDHVEATLGPIDVLVNNAGIMWVGDALVEPEAAALHQFDVNFHGTARGMRLILPRMAARRSGHVVNIASVASRVAPAGEASYAATKHAVYGYTAAVREELRATDVQVSIVMPVVVDTELAAGTSAGALAALQPADVADAVLATLERPRFEVFVPANVGLLVRLVTLLPQAARDRVNRRMIPDQAKQTDAAARRAYEERMVGTGAAEIHAP